MHHSVLQLAVYVHLTKQDLNSLKTGTISHAHWTGTTITFVLLPSGGILFSLGEDGHRIV